MALCEKILIAGFSGAGKSSLLQALEASAPEDWSLFTDLDELILKKHGQGLKQLAELIEQADWEKFRLWERQNLESWLKEEEKGVLALGGGTLTPLLLELYARHPKITIIHLSVPFEEAWQRLNLQVEQPRPLLKRGKQELATIYLERLKTFEQIPWQLDGMKPVEENAQIIWDKIGQ